MKHYRMMAFAMIAAAMTACSSNDDDNDNNGSKGYGELLVGSWLENQSTNGNYLMSQTDYRKDGTMSAWTALVTPTDNVMISYDGTYSISGNALTENYTSPLTGMATQEKYTITQLDDYSYVNIFTGNSTTGVHARIIDTYKMQVGETRSITIDDAAFIPTGYSSLQSRVAIVDGYGQVTALRRGLTFVTISSAIGEAVVRVEVTDPNNVVDDLFAFMGEDISKVEDVYGTVYVEAGSPLIERTYGLLDLQMQTVTFGYGAGQVRMAVARLRPEADIEAVAASFSQKYGQKLNNSNGLDVYLPEKNGQKYMVTLDKLNYDITMMKYVEQTPSGDFTDSDFMPYEGLMNLSAREVAQKLGYTLTDEDLEEGYFTVTPASDNKVFRRVQVIFDEEEEGLPLTSIVLTCRVNITQAQVEPWYAARYTATGDELNQYHNDAENYYICLRETSSGVSTSTTIYYSKRKRSR